MDLVAGVREHLWVPFRVSFPRSQVLPFKVVVTCKNIFTPDEKCDPGLLSPTKIFTPDENIYKNFQQEYLESRHQMGQFLQDGKNDQTLSKKNNLWRFTVTKRFDFFNFSPLF